MYRTDDPIADFDRWDADREAEEARLPICYACGNRILDDYCYQIGGEIICEECLLENYRKLTEDFMDGGAFNG